MSSDGLLHPARVSKGPLVVGAEWWGCRNHGRSSREAPSISNNSTNGGAKGQSGEGLALGHTAISGLKSMVPLPLGSVLGETSHFLRGQLCSYVLRE